MRLPLGSIPGVGIVTNVTLNGFVQKMLERMGWRTRTRAKRTEDEVTETGGSAEGKGTSGIFASEGEYRGAKSWETALIGDLSALPQDLHSGDIRSFATTQGSRNEQKTSTTTTAKELAHQDLPVDGKDCTTVRVGKQKIYRVSMKTREELETKKGDENNPEMLCKTDSSALHSERNGAAFEDALFGTPAAIDDAGGFGSSIYVTSSGCLSSDAVETRSKSKGTEDRKKNSNWKEQAPEDEEDGPLGVTADKKIDGPGFQSMVPVKRSTRKRKRKMYLGEEDSNEREKSFKKSSGRKSLKSGLAKKRGPRSSQRWKTVSGITEDVLNEPDLENRGVRNVGKRGISKQVRKGVKGPRGPRRRRIKFDKKSKSDASTAKHKRAMGDAQSIMKRRQI